MEGESLHQFLESNLLVSSGDGNQLPRRHVNLGPYWVLQPTPEAARGEAWRN
jgi:hypothetical protein